MSGATTGLRALLFVALVSPAVATQVAPDEPRPLASQLLGHWSLVSIESVSGGQTAYPFGRDAVGHITYDAAGHMAVQIMNPNRSPFASGDKASGTVDELSTAFHGYVAYYGTYTVDDKSQVVIHRVVGSLFPNRVGTERPRHIALDGDHLTLSTPPTLFAGKSQVFRVVWRRLE